ncbi:MAG: helix-turn-helix domain-containing protein [Patescibacteria group bacterium]|nr:excisionase family DNA-binding protein [Patescibacteria group bacterium]MDE2014972.1 helix-turn-helix domain-containing protein [Patescibacteria group bacterium]MDE2226401.1 helix-turn-helix domain-containing protein [Patescibacteria group bacterium]
MEKELLSTSEVARLLGISRIAVFKKIKSGEIKASKVGRNFVVRKSEFPEILGIVLGEDKKRLIESAVRKTVKEYGQTLKLLGKE